MASSIYQSYVARHPTRVRDVTNVEFVAKKLDEAMDNHDHDGVNSPQIDLSLNYDFNAAGGNVYVKTPGSTSDDEEFPDTSDLMNTYTRDVIDTKLNGKSNVSHTHITDNIVGFPTALKNPETLTINGMTYDGSTPVNVTVIDDALLNDRATNVYELIMESISPLIEAKTDKGHTHQYLDVANIYSDEHIDIFFEERDMEISSLDTRLSAIEEGTSGVSNIVKAVKDSLYPVGSIYMSVSPTNPSSFIGGTWEAWGSGRVPVGVDSSQAEFDSVEKTGGEKSHALTIEEMPAHDHGLIVAASAQAIGFSAVLTSDEEVGVKQPIEGSNTTHNNLQPYVTCYMWKRIV